MAFESVVMQEAKVKSDFLRSVVPTLPVMCQMCWDHLGVCKKVDDCPQRATSTVELDLRWLVIGNFCHPK